MAAGTQRRVVVTGMGIVSCLGNDFDSVSDSLRQTRPGIRFIPEYAELGLRSQVAGVPGISPRPLAPWQVAHRVAKRCAYGFGAPALPPPRGLL